VISPLRRALAKLRATEARVELEAQFADLVMGSDRLRMELLATIAALDLAAFDDVVRWAVGQSDDLADVAAAAAGYLDATEDQRCARCQCLVTVHGPTGCTRCQCPRLVRVITIQGAA
jgi:hypothetical protein